MEISLWNSWKISSWHPMWYTIGENCKGTIYNLIYCTRKWKIGFLFEVLWVYYFSHKPLHIGGLHQKDFNFWAFLSFSLISFDMLSKLHGWVIIYNGWVIEFSFWILPTLLMWKVKMIFLNLLVETRAH